MNTKSILTFVPAARTVRTLASCLTVSLIFLYNVSFAQDSRDKVKIVMKEFHQALVKKDTATINRLTHVNLSYGHSNGLIETKAEILKNNISRYLDYNSFKEDSINIVVTGNVAYARFTADINSSRAGNPPAASHLKVMEVWIMEKKQWLLLARQAVK